MKKPLLHILLLLLVVNLTTAANWYAAPNGNDNNDGTLSSPFKTVDRAIEAANPGDIIELRNGNYTSGEIRVTKNNLTIRSYPGEWAVIQAPVNNEDIASCIWYNEPEVEFGLLERLEIIGGYYYGVSFETNWDWGVPDNQRHGVSNITIRNCIIHHTGRDCIKIKPECNNISIIACELHHSGVGPGNADNPNAEGIDNVNGDNMIVRNCYIHDISTSGVYAKGGAQNCFIDGNLIMNTGEAGILLGFYTDAEYFDTNTNPDYYECQYSTAYNNIIVNTGGAGIGFFAARYCSAYNNTVVTASTQFHAPLYCSPGDIWISNNLTLNPANEHLLIFNNIFVDQSPADDDHYTVRIREGALEGDNTFDHNIYYKTTGSASFDDGVSWPALTLAEWKSQMGFDPQSEEANPQLNSQFHLAGNSPCIDAGQNTPVTITDYDGHARSGTIDIGADESDNGAALPVPPPAGTIGTGAVDPVRRTINIAPVSKYQVSPNPAADYLQIEGPETPVSISLYDTKGNHLNSYQNTRRIEITSLTPGMYFLKIETAEGFEIKKIIKI
jgi:hypothetical protein